MENTTSNTRLRRLANTVGQNETVSMHNTRLETWLNLAVGGSSATWLQFSVLSAAGANISRGS